MSLNAILEQQHLPDVAVLVMLVDEHFAQWQQASTKEARLVIENKVVALFEKLQTLDFQLSKVSPGDYPEEGEMRKFYDSYALLVKSNLTKLQRVASAYRENYNVRQVAMTQAAGQLKRIKQKQSALSLWERESVKFLVADSFNNYDELDTNYTSDQAGDVDFHQGILTLPVIKKEPANIKRVTIGANSTGFAGNSDVSVDTNNSNPIYMADGNDNTWFEYERLDDGPLMLELICELTQSQVINHLELEPVVNALGFGYQVDDIFFSTNGRDKVAVSELREFENRAVEMSVDNAQEAWRLSFLPVRCKTITLILRQDNFYPIFKAVGNQTRARSRFSVGIKSVKFDRKRYATVGGINSTTYTIPDGNYAAAMELHITPTNTDFYDLNREVSTDGGATWSDADATVLLNGSETTLLWRVAFTRLDDVFTKLGTFKDLSRIHTSVRTVLRTVSRFNSPSSIALTSRPNSEKVAVVQPKVLQRTDVARGLKLSNDKALFSTFDLPISLLDVDLAQEAVWLTVNGQLYQNLGFVQDGSVSQTDVVGAGWVFTKNYDQIYVFGLDTVTSLGTANPEKAYDVRFGLEPEDMLLTEAADGYHHTTVTTFDPDKKNIRVSIADLTPVQVIKLLPAHRKVIQLGEENLIADGLEFRKTDGTLLTSGTALEVKNATKDYFLDATRGVVHLSAALDDDLVQAIYQHVRSIDVAEDKFSIVYDDDAWPIGIRVDKDALPAAEFTETLGDALTSRVSFSKNTGALGGTGFLYTAKADNLSVNTKARTLSQDCVIRGSAVASSDMLNSTLPPQEVKYVDGKSEFLGLIPMLTETTAALQAGINSYAQFFLTARELYFSEVPVAFSNTSVFTTPGTLSAAITGPAGNYHVADDGLVTVNIGVGATLTAGVNIYYHYRDPGFDPTNKFSIDYVKGVLYGGAALNSTGTISYKSVCAKVSYDVARKVDSFTYNADSNTLQVRTEGLLEINSLVKVLWIEEERDENFSELSEYFSPIISNASVRLT